MKENKIHFPHKVSGNPLCNLSASHQYRDSLHYSKDRKKVTCQHCLRVIAKMMKELGKDYLWTKENHLPNKDINLQHKDIDLGSEKEKVKSKFIPPTDKEMKEFESILSYGIAANIKITFLRDQYRDLTGNALSSQDINLDGNVYQFTLYGYPSRVILQIPMDRCYLNGLQEPVLNKDYVKEMLSLSRTEKEVPLLSQLIVAYLRQQAKIQFHNNPHCTKERIDEVHQTVAYDIKDKQHFTHMATKNGIGDILCCPNSTVFFKTHFRSKTTTNPKWVTCSDCLEMMKKKIAPETEKTIYVHYEYAGLSLCCYGNNKFFPQGLEYTRKEEEVTCPDCLRDIAKLKKEKPFIHARRVSCYDKMECGLIISPFSGHSTVIDENVTCPKCLTILNYRKEHPLPEKKQDTETDYRHIKLQVLDPPMYDEVDDFVLMRVLEFTKPTRTECKKYIFDRIWIQEKNSGRSEYIVENATLYLSQVGMNWFGVRRDFIHGIKEAVSLYNEKFATKTKSETKSMVLTYEVE